MAKDNTTRYILLGLLRHMPMSGYDLKKRIDLSIRQFWNVGYAQIYPTLAALERDGMVIKTVLESIKGPQRHIYVITEAGERALTQWLLLPVEKEYTKYELLLKLFFGAGVPVESSIERIAAFEKRQTESLSMIRLFRQNLEGVLDGESDHLYYYLTVLFGEQVYAAYQSWSQQALSILHARAEGRPLPIERHIPRKEDEP